MKKHKLLWLLVIMTNTLFAQLNKPPGLNLIRTDGMKKDLFALADAHFNGRSAGTLDELKAAMWMAEKFRHIGLQPAGDDGTFFQYFTLWRNQLADNSSIQINNISLALWKEVAVSQMANISLHAPIVYLGNVSDIDTNTIDVKDKVIALEANSKGINLNVSLPTWRYSRYIFTKYGMPLLRKGAAAIIFIADDVAEKAWDDASENYKRGTYDIEGGANVNITTTAPVIWLHAPAKKELQDNKGTLNANLIIAKYPYPSVNIVGKIDGTDLKLKSDSMN